MIGRVYGAAATLLVLIIAAVAIATAEQRVAPRTHPRKRIPAVAHCSAARVRPPFAGVVPGAPWGKNLATFIRTVGVHPQIIIRYLRFGAPYDPAVACRAARAGGELLIQWDPVTTPLSQIAGDRWDRYITSFARAIHAARIPVILSFAHEMNGPWYPWGYRHVSPATFIAAWRHLHNLFAQAGASNVTWCWTVNRAIRPGFISPPGRWWPGGRYVDWAGLDAYYNKPADTFRSVFAAALPPIRAVTGKPVLIAETAAAAGPWQARQIRSLFAGVEHTKGIIGLVWFDANGRETWRLEGHPAAIAAFRAGARALTQ